MHDWAGYTGSVCQGRLANLHGAHVKATQKELDRYQQLKHGPVHVSRGACKHEQLGFRWLIATRALLLSTTSIASTAVHEHSRHCFAQQILIVTWAKILAQQSQQEQTSEHGNHRVLQS